MPQATSAQGETREAPSLRPTTWTTDAALRILSFSAPRAPESDRALVGRPVTELGILDDHGAYGRALSGESTVVRTSSRGRELQVRIDPLRDAAGAIVGTGGVALDITEYQRALDERRADEEHIRSLIHASPDPIFLKDGEGRWLIVNDAALALFQLDGVDYRERTDAELAEFTSFYGPALRTCVDSDEQAWLRGELTRCEERIPRPDGAVRTYDVYKVPLFRSDGSRKSFVVLGRDISDRIRAEEYREQLLRQEQAARLAAEKAARGATMLADVSRVLSSEPGTSSLRAAAARTVPLLCDGCAIDLVVDSVLRRVIVEPEGAVIDSASTTLRIPLVARGAVLGAITFLSTREERRFDPITEELAADVARRISVALENGRLFADLEASLEQLRRTQEALVRRERLAVLGELAAVVSHEVRNPLAVMFNCVAALRRNHPSEGEAAQLLDIVEEEGQRIDRIVRELLGLARPLEPTLRPMALGEVVEEAVSAAWHERGPRPDVQVDVQAEPLPEVSADAQLLHMAIVNLVTNALAAMPRGGTLSVRVERAPDGEWSRIVIRDSGTGIAPEVRERLFEPFFTTRTLGHGLGLAIVKRIVEAHAGKIAVESAVDRGTTFTILLPLAATAPRA